jgi:hypothetical protein
MFFKKGLSTRFFTNPLYLYCISFVFVISIYSLNWSNLYCNLSANLLIFILITICFSSIIAPFFNKYSEFRPIPISMNNKYIMIFIVVGTIAEYIYCRGIPLISVLLGTSGSYKDYTWIPSFHVLLAGICSFFCVYVFHQYQSHIKVKYLRNYFLLCLFIQILNLSRGMFIYIVFPCIFLYLSRIKRLSSSKIIVSLCSIIVAFALFGLSGNIRDSNSQNNNEYILKIGGANQRFIDTHIPSMFYWVYLYIASPIGNLENTIEISNPQPSLLDYTKLFITLSTPDFIQKRLPENYRFIKSDYSNYLVSTSLNVSTVYSYPYIYAGWMGMIYMFMFMFVVIIFYLGLIGRSSPYFLTGWFFICTSITLNVFSNMWVANGLYFSFIPIVVSIIKKIKIKSIKKDEI